MTEFRDLAGDVAAEYQRKQAEGLEEVHQPSENERVLKRDNNRTLFSKIKFSWKAEDKNTLEQIRAAVNSMINDTFSEAYAIIDGVYESVRVPELNSSGVVRTNQEGRIIWEKDESGKLIEDWSKLDGLDIEKALFDLERVKIPISLRTSELYSEALYAKHLFDDKWWDTYSEQVDGTQNDRSSRANRQSAEEKYHSFFRYLLWERVNVFLKEVQSLMRLLEKVRDWRIRSER